MYDEPKTKAKANATPLHCEAGQLICCCQNKITAEIVPSCHPGWENMENMEKMENMTRLLKEKSKFTCVDV